MRISYEGREFDYDPARLRMSEAIRIEKYLGCPIGEFGDRLDTSGGKDPDLKAIQCVAWLILHGGDRDVPIEDTDFEVAGFVQAVAEAGKAEQAAGEAPPVPEAVPAGA